MNFRHYTTKHRIVAWLSQNLFDRVTYRVRRGLLTGLRRRGGLAFIPNWLVEFRDTPETAFWRELDLRGAVVYDVGAYHGLLALWFSQQASTVICYEPNSANRTRLSHNLALNKVSNVVVRPLGLGACVGSLTMVWDRLMPGGASVEQAITAQTTTGDFLTEQISIATLDADIAEQSLPAPDFIKIDIEGFELDALRGATNTLQKYSPALFLEMHGATSKEKLDKVNAIVSFLKDYGYSHIRHIESGQLVTCNNASLASQGHLYATRLRAS